jgi:hypothetical protein
MLLLLWCSLAAAAEPTPAARVENEPVTCIEWRWTYIGDYSQRECHITLCSRKGDLELDANLAWHRVPESYAIDKYCLHADWHDNPECFQCVFGMRMKDAYEFLRK